MTSLQLSTALQLLIGLGLMNVWLVRAASPTVYRGGGARTLRDEFAEYGLPDLAFYVVGALKIGAAIMLVAGIWIAELVLPAALVVVVLMLGALAMHVKVKDPAIRSVPALLVLAMSAGVCALAVG